MQAEATAAEEQILSHRDRPSTHHGGEVPLHGGMVRPPSSSVCSSSAQTFCVCRYYTSHTLLVEQRLEKDKLVEVVRESDAALR